MEKRTNLNSTLFFSQTIRPLATSTPYDLPHSRQQRPFFTPPIYCSTPKQTRHSSPKFPMIISRRRLQFTTNSNNESQRMTIKNIKIWLL